MEQNLEILTSPRFTYDLNLIIMISGIAITSAGYFLPLLLTAKGISDVQIGYLGIILSFFLVVSNTIFGKLTDKRGRKPFLLIGLLSSSITSILYIFPNRFVSFAIIQFLNGFSFGIFPAAIISIASDRNSPLGNLSSWQALGAVLGAIITGFIAQLFNLEKAFIFASLLFFISFLIAYFANTGSSPILAEHKNHVEPKYWSVIKANWKIYVTYLLRHSAANSIWIYFTLFMQNNLNMNTVQIGTILAVNTGTQVIFMKIFGDKGNPKKMFLLGTILSAITFSTFPLTKNYIQLLSTQLLLGISFSFFFTGAIRSIQLNSEPLNMIGTGMGLFQATISVSQLLGPVLALIIFVHFHTYTSIMYIASIITFFAAIFYFIFLVFIRD